MLFTKMPSDKKVKNIEIVFMVIGAILVLSLVCFVFWWRQDNWELFQDLRKLVFSGLALILFQIGILLLGISDGSFDKNGLHLEYHPLVYFSFGILVFGLLSNSGIPFGTVFSPIFSFLIFRWFLHVQFKRSWLWMEKRFLKDEKSVDWMRRPFRMSDSQMESYLDSLLRDKDNYFVNWYGWYKKYHYRSLSLYQLSSHFEELCGGELEPFEARVQDIHSKSMNARCNKWAVTCFMFSLVCFTFGAETPAIGSDAKLDSKGVIVASRAA